MNYLEQQALELQIEYWELKIKVAKTELDYWNDKWKRG